jgi:dTDP-4-dehydrorhamnose 3,5-epimerase
LEKLGIANIKFGHESLKMNRFEIEETPIEGVKVLTRKKLADERGFLSRLYCQAELFGLGWVEPISQINETMTKEQGTVRGFHFQRDPFSEMKLVSCIEGAIFDVAIDLRENSPTFLQHFACELSDKNDCTLLIPKGCAHGFQALSDDVHMIYCHSAPYNSEFEDGINVVDKTLGINWPLTPKNLSKRDTLLPFLNEKFQGIAA